MCNTVYLHSSSSSSFFPLPFSNYFLGSGTFVPDLPCRSFDMSEIPDGPKFQEHTNYLVDNYIGEDAIFPFNILPAFAADLTRTANNFIVFHAQFDKTHSSIFIFLDILIKQITIQTDVCIEIRSSIKHIPYTPKNSKVHAR